MEQNRRLFTFLLPRKELANEQELYYRVTAGNVCAADDRLSLKKDSTLSFNCFYGVFDYAVYREKTAVRSLLFHLSLQGDLIVRAYCTHGRDAKKPKTDLLCEERFSAKEQSKLSFSLPLPAEEKGFVYLTLTSESESAFFGGYIEAQEDPLRSVKIGLAITTFRREAFVKRNVAAITRDLPKEEFGVFVVDNGGTLSPEDLPGATLFPNKNLGGSGGFTRGILEIRKRKEYTHILLTDDDITFESEIFLRTAAILRYVLDPARTVIGAAMMELDCPYYQHEFGAEWNGIIKPHNRGIDLRDPSSLLKNALAPAAEFSAWWFNCIPSDLPDRIGLPFPFFIKIDDIEYGLRAKCDILLLNGIGVWHEAFDNKYSALWDYYSKRNEQIVNALRRPRLGPLYEFGKLLRSLSKQLIFQRYFAIDLILKAYDDFLAGADHFQTIDAIALHSKLRSLCEKQLPREELEKMGYDLSRPFYQAEPFDSFPQKLKQVFTLNGYLLPRRREDYRLIDMTSAMPKCFYRAARTLQFNPATQTGFVTEQKRFVLLKTAFRIVPYFFKLLFRYRKACRSFRKLFPELTSESAWKERLGESTL